MLIFLLNVGVPIQGRHALLMQGTTRSIKYPDSKDLAVLPGLIFWITICLE